MDIKTYSHDRSFSSQTYALRPYDDNCPDLAQICEDTGRKPGEVLRDLVDEALRARRSPQTAVNLGEISRKLELLVEQNRLANERYEKLLERYEQLEEQGAKLKQGLIAQLRELAGTLVEVLAAAIGARRLAWNYIAYNALKRSKYTEEQIKERWDAENKAWNAERDTTLSEVKRIIRSKWPSQQ